MIEEITKLMQIELSTLQSLVSLCAYARRRRKWVVVVGGTKDMTRQLRQLLLSSKKDGDKYSGRSLRFENGGCLTVTHLEDDFDPPEDFDLAVFGLSTDLPLTPSEERRLALWYNRAAQILTSYVLLEWGEEAA